MHLLPIFIHKLQLQDHTFSGKFRQSIHRSMDLSFFSITDEVEDASIVFFYHCGVVGFKVEFAVEE